MSLLDRLPDEPAPDDLETRTLARVSGSRRPLQLARGTDESERGFGFRLPELLAVAAMIVIGTCLALPILAQNRAAAQRFACETNLSMVGAAIGRYGSDFGDVLPRQYVKPGLAWWNVGKEPRRDAPVESNSAHLYLLARAGYISPDAMACPGNADAPRGMTAAMRDWPRYEAVSYSYQNQYTPQATRLSDAGDMPVLADKNPLFTVEGRWGLQHRDDLPANARSHSHQGKGQNILRATGQVEWSPEPVLDNDNIWLATGVDRYTGVEPPSNPRDTFLVP
jgi:hypothetical protein